MNYERVDECRCGCHSSGAEHEVKCCSGQCDRCGRFIKSGMMDFHLDQHKRRLAEFYAELDEGFPGHIP